MLLRNLHSCGLGEPFFRVGVRGVGTASPNRVVSRVAGLAAVALLLTSVAHSLRGQELDVLARFDAAVRTSRPGGPFPVVAYERDVVKRVLAADGSPQLKALYVLEAALQRLQQDDLGGAERANVLRDVDSAVRFVRTGPLDTQFSRQWARTLLALVVGPDVGGANGAAYLSALERFLQEGEADMIRGLLLEQNAMTMLRTRKTALTGAALDRGSVAVSQALRRSVSDTLRVYRNVSSASAFWHEAQLRQGVMLVEDGRAGEALPLLNAARESADSWVRLIAGLTRARAMVGQAKYDDAVLALSSDEELLLGEPFARVLLAVLRRAGSSRSTDVQPSLTTKQGLQSPWSEYRYGSHRLLLEHRQSLLKMVRP